MPITSFAMLASRRGLSQHPLVDIDVVVMAQLRSSPSLERPAQPLVERAGRARDGVAILGGHRRPAQRVLSWDYNALWRASLSLRWRTSPGARIEHGVSRLRQASAAPLTNRLPDRVPSIVAILAGLGRSAQLPRSGAKASASPTLRSSPVLAGRRSHGLCGVVDRAGEVAILASLDRPAQPAYCCLIMLP
jgi:hypothetical protein